MTKQSLFSALIMLACIVLAGIVILVVFVCGGVVKSRGATDFSSKGSTGRRLATSCQVAANLLPRTRTTFTANVSAYCPCDKCCYPFSDGITASGHVIQPGDKFVAAPPEYPFGTMLNIPGYGIVPVLDRGGAIKGDKLDVYMDSHASALRWGKQRLMVTIRDTNASRMKLKPACGMEARAGNKNKLR